MKNNLKILFTGPFLAALVIILLNDHYLKASYPCWLTGKLSDFAGLFVLAIFIYAIAGKYLRSEKALVNLHLVIGASFVIWKIAPIEILLAEINEIISMPLPGRVKDASDLIALIILPSSYLYIRKFLNAGAVIPTTKLKRCASVAILVIAGFAIIATASGKRYDIQPNIEQKTYMDWPQIRAAFEQALAEDSVKIKSSRAVDDSTTLYQIEFTTDKQVESPKPKIVEVQYVSFLTLYYSPSAKSVAIKDIYGWVARDIPDDKVIDEIYMKRIIEPFLSQLKY